MAEPWYKESNSSAGNFNSSQVTASGDGLPLHLPGTLGSCVVTVIPTGAANVQYSYDSNDVIEAGLGVVWQTWEAGPVTAVKSSLFAVAPAAFRVTGVSGGAARLVVSGPRP